MRYSDNLIPNMTSDTAPSGIVSASSNYNSSFPPWRAFDGSISTNSWVTVNNPTYPQWLSYEFPFMVKATSYTLSSAATGTTAGMPKSWLFQASNDGLTWTTLDNRNEVMDWVAGAKKQFYFNNNKDFKIYRLYITSANTESNNRTIISEFEIMTTIYDEKFLITTEDNSAYSLVPSETIDLVPKMTSNTAPSGQAFGSNYGYNHHYWHAFNKNPSTKWQTGDNRTKNQYIGYTFPSGQIVNKYSINSVGGNAPRSWRLEASNDHVDWIVLDTQENQTNWNAQEPRSFLVNNDIPYLSYRIFVVTNDGGRFYIEISNIYFYQVTEEELIKIDTLNEKSFVYYGLKPKETLDFHKNIRKINYINFTNEVVGSGKIFKQTIENKIKKAIIK